MIRLSRLNHHEVAINCDLIEWIEANPDTTVRMVSGESMIVLESVEEVIRRIIEYRRGLLSSAGLAAALAPGARAVAAFVRPAADESTNTPGGGYGRERR